MARWTVTAAGAAIEGRSEASPVRITVDDGRIAKIQACHSAPERFVLPGFVDLQVNGVDDVNVATAEGADWERLDQALLAGGTTTWCPTLITSPLDSYRAPLQRIGAAASRVGTGRPQMAGAHLEGPFLTIPGAHPPAHLRAIDLDFIAALPPIVRIMTLAPELPGALDAVQALRARGIVVSLGHTACSAAQAAAAATAGATLVTHLFNAMAPLHHRRPGLVLRGLLGAKGGLTPMLIADGVHVDPDVAALAMRASGPILVTDAVAWRAARPDGRAVECIDAPRLPDGTLAGSALTMDAALRNVRSWTGATLSELAAATSGRAAAALGLRDRGRIAVGARADLVALDADLQLEEVWAGGHAAGAGGH